MIQVLAPQFGQVFRIGSGLVAVCPPNAVHHDPALSIEGGRTTVESLVYARPGRVAKEIPAKWDLLRICRAESEAHDRRFRRNVPLFPKRGPAAVNPTMRAQPRKSNVPPGAGTRSRGLKPCARDGQRYHARYRVSGPRVVTRVFGRRPTLRTAPMRRFIVRKNRRGMALPEWNRRLRTRRACTIDRMSFDDYGDKRARNKRIGPGGGTRRLHQDPSLEGPWGRNRIDGRVKVFAFARLGTTVIGPQSIIANDNHAPVALAA